MAGEREALRRDLATLVGRAGVSQDAADGIAYGRDLWPREQILSREGVGHLTAPAAIVWPETLEQVAAVARFAHDRRIAVVPFGAGSGVCGGIAPTADAIVLDVKRMRRLEFLDGSGLRARAQAGMLGQHLEEALAARGFTLGHFPSSIHCSTLGGWIAGRSAGQCSGRYGKIEDMVTALTCVDGRGDIWRVGETDADRALLPLVTGSEGAFAVVTDATLRIAPAPQDRRFGSFMFPSVEAGLDAMRRMYQAGLRPAVARLYDPFDTWMALRSSTQSKKAGPSANIASARVTRWALRSASVLNQILRTMPDSLLGGALLVLVWEDDARIAEAEMVEARRLAEGGGGEDRGPRPAMHWLRHRHAVSYRQSALYAAGAFVDTMEVSSTWSRLLAMYTAVRRALAPHVFVMAHFSHCYPDGASIYFTFAGAGGSTADALAKYDQAWRAAVFGALEAGGTLSHHHGVGRSKTFGMQADHVRVIRAAKELFDPRGILNPGVLTPASPQDARPVPRPTTPVEHDHGIRIDATSLLVSACGDTTLPTLERRLGAHGLSLGLAQKVPDQSLAQWLAEGARGSRTRADDPVDHVLAGFTAVLADGAQVVVTPAPRRATGPDIGDALVGDRGALGRIVRADLVVRRKGALDRLCFSFPAESGALAALAWMRGLGVRPASSQVERKEGDTALLRVNISGSTGRREAASAVAREVATTHGGAEVLATPFAETAAAPSPASATTRELGRILRRRGRPSEAEPPADG